MEKISFKADPYKINTLIENLLGNAIKYARSTIRVEFSRTNSHFLFVVSDDGHGISEKYQEKIFDEYFQVPASKQGTGLGLYSVKKVVENHKGNIILDSSINAGTRFTVTIPLETKH